MQSIASQAAHPQSSIGFKEIRLCLIDPNALHLHGFRNTISFAYCNIPQHPIQSYALYAAKQLFSAAFRQFTHFGGKHIEDVFKSTEMQQFRGK